MTDERMKELADEFLKDMQHYYDIGSYDAVVIAKVMFEEEVDFDKAREIIEND